MKNKSGLNIWQVCAALGAAILGTGVTANLAAE